MNERKENKIKMRKTKTQKGITLIALIITIVVLLILAAVAISSITNDNILGYAQNAAKDYNQAVKNEQEMLQEYVNFLNGNGNGNGSSGEATIGDATVGTKVDKNSTINGEQYSATNPIIPAGFMPINTDTSNWEAEDLAGEVKKGLVISDGTSEFVWIPVAEINSFARLQDGSETNYRGVLYNWNTDATGATEYTWTSTGTSYREPANLSTSYDSTTNLSTWTENLYQESFNKMVESVAEYKGFYVGRYETSLNGSTAQSTSGATPMNSINWFRMYENSKAYSTSNESLGVVSEMIWGCQWDAMLKLILTGPDSTHVTATSNVGHTGSNFTSTPYKTGGTNYTEVYTGSTTYNDIASNIYDLEGNVREWTREADNTLFRVLRGGDFNNSRSPNPRLDGDPAGSSYYYGSRLSLYVAL